MSHKNRISQIFYLGRGSHKLARSMLLSKNEILTTNVKSLSNSLKLALLWSNLPMVQCEKNFCLAYNLAKFDLRNNDLHENVQSISSMF